MCHDVSAQPALQPVLDKVTLRASTNSQDGAQVDIAAIVGGFWHNRFDWTFLDAMGSATLWTFQQFYPYVILPVNVQKMNKHSYQQHIREVELVSLMHLVLSATNVHSEGVNNRGI